jgi:phosphatidylethanolamine-binding protein (PEBP) family uncharacterized protein
MYASLRVFTIVALIAASPVSAFEMQFDWGKLVLCTSGSPNTVANPIFTLGDVPDGTRFIRFALVDQDAPGYPHGGGTVPFTGQKVIARGAFTYQSPCPPSGRHTYEWSATALSRQDGGELGIATAAKLYP